MNNLDKDSIKSMSISQILISHSLEKKVTKRQLNPKIKVKKSTSVNKILSTKSKTKLKKVLIKE
jgi:hypothetical protein